MAEMIVPGTYIDVRAEGLISAGRIASGIVGIVGTAASGPVGEAVTLAGAANARDTFGASDPFARPEDGSNPLTLVRALEYLYKNGASTVLAVRVASSRRAAATYAVQDGSARTVALLTATTAGTWGNDIQIEVNDAEDHGLISDETQVAGFSHLGYPMVVHSAENRLQVTRGLTRRVLSYILVYKEIVRNERVIPDAGGHFILGSVDSDHPLETVAAVNRIRVLDSSDAPVREYGDGAILYGAGAPPGVGEVRINSTNGAVTFEATQVPSAGQKVFATYAIGHPAPLSGEALITTWNGDLAFFAGEAPNAGNGDKLVANYRVDQSTCVELALTYGAVINRVVAPDGKMLAAGLNANRSRLAGAVADGVNGFRKPKSGVASFLGAGSNGKGDNGADAGADDYAAGLEVLADKLVNIVVLAGQDASTMGDTLQGHLRATEETDHERIGVIGASGSTVADFLGHSLADERVVLVAPGIKLPDKQVLPPAYTAAAVAGLISSLPVQTSLTNKTLSLSGLDLEANRGQQEQLIKRNVLAVINKEGLRVLRGMTTSGEGTPFSAIPTRRIVDYAKYGVRSAANPYLGRLNNDRVRSALKATLDAFLTRMVQDEALTKYDLAVTATRAQEIAGEVSVVMTLQPTFSIEYIRVTMNLQ